MFQIRAQSQDGKVIRQEIVSKKLTTTVCSENDEIIHESVIENDGGITMSMADIEYQHAGAVPRHVKPQQMRRPRLCPTAPRANPIK